MEQNSQALTQSKIVFRIKGAVALLVVVNLGFAFKYALGLHHIWFSDYGAGLLYEVFWILMAGSLYVDRGELKRVCLAVFIVTCALEVLQLWRTPWLNRIRETFIGKALLGTDFDWLDFPHYALGCLIGYGLLKWFHKRPLVISVPPKAGGI